MSAGGESLKRMVERSDYVAQLVAKLDQEEKARPCLRRLYRHECSVCRGSFSALSAKAIYCGDLCRDVARERRGRTAS